LLAIVGGRVIDGTGGEPIEEGVILVEGDRIEAVGRRGEVEVPEDAEVIDASGKTVLPGFIDAHCHFLYMGLGLLRYVDLSQARSLEEALELVKRRVEETPKGRWVLGRGWDESLWPERRYITKGDLDPLSPDNPIMLVRICGHLISVNSKALELAGITRETPNPPGGLIDRGPDGEPTGILRDARELLERVIPPPSEEEALEGLRRACDLALRLGCTSIQDAGLDPKALRIYQRAWEEGVLRVRAYLMLAEEAAEAAERLGIKTGFGDERLRLGSVKLLADGSMGARTAALFEPYADDPSTKGIFTLDPEELRRRIKEAHSRGFQLAVHAIGDRAIEEVVDAIEEALRERPRRDHRHRIEHCEVLTPNQIERIRELSLIASMQPNFVGNWSGPGGMYEARLGPERLRRNNPYRALMDEGVHMAFGSDSMPFHPLYGIWSAVNHPIRESRITVVEAVKCYTLEAAYSSFEEHLKGSLEPGKLADIVIIDGDLLEEPKGIKDMEVYMTIVGGEILYTKGSG